MENKKPALSIEQFIKSIEIKLKRETSPEKREKLKIILEEFKSTTDR